MKKYKYNKLITCLSNRGILYKYNITNFTYETKKYIEAYGYPKTIIEKNNLNNMLICISVTSYYCQKYNINLDSFPINLNSKLPNSYDIFLEYFQEREEFVLFRFKNGEFLFETISYDFSKDNIYDLKYIFDINTCGNPTRINLFYAQNIEKYGIFTNFNNSNCQNIIYLNEIDSPKLIDFTFDDPPILICDKYYNYNKTNCIDSIPKGFYCNNSIEKTIDKCHENCETCSKGPSSDNNNCESCKKKLFSKI